MRILFLTAEAVPYVKIGGLADVSGSLPQAIKELGGHDIRVIMPFYGLINKVDHQIETFSRFNFVWSGKEYPVKVLTTNNAGLPFYFLSLNSGDMDNSVYTNDIIADSRKFFLFSIATLEFIRHHDWQPHIIHANDWHTAVAVYLLSNIRPTDDFFSSTSSLLTIHNLPFLGQGSQPVLEALNIGPTEANELPGWAKHLPLPMGLAAADFINLVSPSYALEVTTSQYGSGLEHFFQSRSDTKMGILNGIDLEKWNPSTDDHLKLNYSVESVENRGENKIEVQKIVGFDQDIDIPLLSMINRMDYQKGIDLIPEALEMIDDLAWQLIIIGSGDSEIERIVKNLQNRYPNNVCVKIGYFTSLARMIYAGADAIIIPSRYEPCGLTQMIAMRYGAIPIARRTGGLQDTIVDVEIDRNQTGFLFDQDNSYDLAVVLRRAIEAYRDKSRWVSIQKEAMAQDFSWKNSAAKYIELYRSIAARRNGNTTGSL